MIMKLKHIAIFALSLTVSNLTAQTNDASLVVHEWGTFTSFQGGDGTLMSWKPLQSSALPQFVYDWSKPGLNRQYITPYVGKGRLMTLQRMETPVVYFYSDQDMAVDLTVKFPQGRITEWFPQADQVGPSRPASPGASSNSLSSESLIHWSNLLLLPPKKFAAAYQTLPTDTNGSHYFAARETDSDYIVSSPGPDDASPTMNSAALNCGGAPAPAPLVVQPLAERLSMVAVPKVEIAAKPPPEVEKFLFYRGAGSFATPLRVKMASDDAVVLENTGSEPLAHLFVLGVKDHSGNFVYVADLPPGAKKTVPIKMQSSLLPGDQLTQQISDRMAESLKESGLYPREATAMVNTWKDSWFQENGVRVLYVLPRTWTDHTLPMTLNPSPKSLVRVMVGRAEIFTPAAEQTLALQLKQVEQGNAVAAVHTRELLKGLGRFAEPAFFRAFAANKSTPAELPKLIALLDESRASN